MKRYLILAVVLIAVSINLSGLTGFSDSEVDVGLNNAHLPIDIPQVTIEIVNVDGNDYVRLSWETVESAVSYKIFATEESFLPVGDWGEPLDIITETTYNTPVDDNIRYFYYIIASTEEE